MLQNYWFKIKNAPFVVIGLVLVNVVLFLLVELGGPSENALHLYHWGALLPSAVTQEGEYWRVLTAMFLHFGVMHLASNMLVLFALGTVLEKGLGHLRVFLIYMLSGIGANLFALFWYVKTDQAVIAAGASGAVFGLMGAMAFAGLFAKEWVGSLSPAQVLMMLILSLYHGVNEAVSDAAHLSGLVIGCMLAILLLKIFPGKRGL